MLTMGTICGTIIREGLLILFLVGITKFIYRKTFGKLVKIFYKFGLLNKKTVNKFKKKVGKSIIQVTKFIFGGFFNLFKSRKTDEKEHPNVIDIKVIRGSKKKKASI